MQQRSHEETQGRPCLVRALLPLKASMLLMALAMQAACLTRSCKQAVINMLHHNQVLTSCAGLVNMYSAFHPLLILCQ